MLIESTPAGTSRITKPRVDFEKAKNLPYIGVRNTYAEKGVGLELSFISADNRNVTVTLSPEERNELIMFVAEKVIPQIIREWQKK